MVTILLIPRASKAQQIDTICFTQLPLIWQLSNSGQDDESMMPESKKKFLDCFLLVDGSVGFEDCNRVWVFGMSLGHS